MKKTHYNHFIFPAFITGALLGGLGYLSIVKGFEMYQLPIFVLCSFSLGYFIYHRSLKKGQHS